MKIVVPVKEVAALDDEFVLLDGGSGVDPSGLEWDMNEWDAFSLEQAVQLRDAVGAGEVVAITVGDEHAEEGLVSALAKGADRAMRIWDEQLAYGDALAVARVLAAVIEPESPDLVLCGVQSSDAVNSATGIALAGYLRLSHIAVVKRIEYDPATATAAVERELEGGLVERLRIELPALLTVQTGINEPRYANLRAIKQAREKPLAVLGLADVGLDAVALEAVAGSKLVALSSPNPDHGAEMLNGSPAAVASRIVEIVQQRMST